MLPQGSGGPSPLFRTKPEQLGNQGLVDGVAVGGRAGVRLGLLIRLQGLCKGRCLLAFFFDLFDEPLQVLSRGNLRCNIALP